MALTKQILARKHINNNLNFKSKLCKLCSLIELQLSLYLAALFSYLRQKKKETCSKKQIKHSLKRYAETDYVKTYFL